jgi:hypothetical protein
VSVETEIRAVAERLESDREFADRLEQSVTPTLRTEGYDELAASVERAQARIAELAEQLCEDDELMAEIKARPGALTDHGVPAEGVEEVLLALGAPAEVVELARPDVEAHRVSDRSYGAGSIVHLGAVAFMNRASERNPIEHLSTLSHVQPLDYRTRNLAGISMSGALHAHPVTRRW